MNEKEIAGKIVLTISEGKEKFNGLKKSINDYIDWIISENAEILNSIETEEQFFGVLAEILDDNTNTGIFDAVDGIFIRKALFLIDKKVIDKLAGEDWFPKLKTKIKNVLEGVR